MSPVAPKGPSKDSHSEGPDDDQVDGTGVAKLPQGNETVGPKSPLDHGIMDNTESSSAQENELPDDIPTDVGSVGDKNGAIAPALIGQVGLAAAREAPGNHEEAINPDLSPNATITEPADSASHGDSEAHLITKETEHSSLAEISKNPLSPTSPAGSKSMNEPTMSSVDSLKEVKQAGEVEEPETPRSAPATAPAPDSGPGPSGPFGRIGHPGAERHELESPNSVSTTENTGDDKERNGGEDGKVGIKWNEDELKRDPAKTIISPDTKNITSDTNPHSD